MCQSFCLSSEKILASSEELRVLNFILHYANIILLLQGNVFKMISKEVWQPE